MEYTITGGEDCVPFRDTTSYEICSGSSITIGTNTYTSSGTYADTLAACNRCDSVITTILNVNMVDVVVTVNGNTLVAPDVSGATYEWIDCNLNILLEGATSNTYAATATGSYPVIITAEGCTDTSACHEITGTGIVTESVTLSIQTFASNYIIIKGLRQPTEFKLYDVVGQEILSAKINTDRRIPIAHLGKGI